MGSSTSLNVTVFPRLQQATHLRLEYSERNLPGDVESLLSEITETVPHPVLAIPPLFASDDRDAYDKRFELGKLVHGEFAHCDAAAPSIGVLMWLVPSYAHGVGVRVPYDLVCVTDTRTSWDMDCPV